MLWTALSWWFNVCRTHFSYVLSKKARLSSKGEREHLHPICVALNSDTVDWCMVAQCPQNLHQDGSSFTWHQPCKKSTALQPLWWIYNQNTLYKASHSFRVAYKSSTVGLLWSTIVAIVKHLGLIWRWGVHWAHSHGQLSPNRDASGA